MWELANMLYQPFSSEVQVSIILTAALVENLGSTKKALINNTAIIFMVMIIEDKRTVLLHGKGSFYLDTAAGAHPVAAVSVGPAICATLDIIGLRGTLSLAWLNTAAYDPQGILFSFHRQLHDCAVLKHWNTLSRLGTSEWIYSIS